jgi:hypothetical protein
MDGAITPEIARIHLLDHREILELRFSSAPGVDRVVALDSIRFLSAEQLSTGDPT